jgi:hypothetical protein
MAKRRKTKTTTRRRRVSGVGKLNTGNLVNQIGGVLIGVAAAGYLNKLALQGRSNMIQGAVPIIAGIALPMFLKSDLGKFAGAGMVAYGGGKFLANAGLAGIGADDSFGIPVSISGEDQLSIMAGDEFAMAGDEFAMAGDDFSSLAGINMLNDEDDV